LHSVLGHCVCGLDALYPDMSRVLRLAGPFASATLPLLLRCGPATTAALHSPVSLADRPSPTRCAFLLRSRTCHYFPVVALATVLLAHVSAFGRFDEIVYLVEKTSANITPSMASQPGLSRFATPRASLTDQPRPPCLAARHNVARPWTVVRAIRRDIESRRQVIRPHPSGFLSGRTSNPLSHPVPSPTLASWPTSRLSVRAATAKNWVKPFRRWR
jgi:hypothetical protein